MDVLYKKVFDNYDTIFYKPQCEINLTDRLKNRLIPNNEFKTPNTKISEVSNNGGWYYDKTSNDEEILKGNYNNLLCSIHSRRCTIVVEKNEKKIALKIFHNTFTRNVGVKYFRKNTQLTFLSYRYKDGALFYGEMFDYHKKRKYRKSIRRFTFGSRDIIQDINYELRKVYNSHFDFDYRTVMDTFIHDTIKSNGEVVDTPTKKIFYKSFLNKNGIKYSNNFMSFVDLSYPSLLRKDFTKNNFKLIDTVMFKYGLSGKKIKRILHKVNLFRTDTYLWALQFFGERFINSQHDDTLIKMFEKSLSLSISPVEFTMTERRNAFEIFKLVLSDSIDINVFKDHIKFYRFLNEFENIKWESCSYDHFNEEHYKLSEKYDSYTQGNFNRGYNKYFVHDVEHVILGENYYYNPKILTKSKDYYEESSYQSNCVRTYVKTPESLIISLRRNNGDRATIEYDIRSLDGKNLTLKRVQTLGKFNSTLDESWDKSISLLDDRVYHLSDSGIFDEVSIESNQHYNLKTGIKIVDGWNKNKSPLITPVKRYRIEWEDSRIYKLNRVDDFYDSFNLPEFILHDD